MSDELPRKERALDGEPDLLSVLEYYVALRRSGQPLEPRGERFEFTCSKSWDELRRTEDDEVRHCRECERPVYFAPDEASFEKHAALGRCVAIRDDQVEARFEALPRYFGRALPLEEGSRCLVLIDPIQALGLGILKAAPDLMSMGQPPPPKIEEMPRYVQEQIAAMDMPRFEDPIFRHRVFAREVERLRDPQSPQERLEAVLLYYNTKNWNRGLEIFEED